MRYDVEAQEINLVPNMGGMWGTHAAKVGSAAMVKKPLVLLPLTHGPAHPKPPFSPGRSLGLFL